MKILLTNSSSFTVGDVAISNCMIEQIRSVVPDAEITIESGNASVHREYQPGNDIHIVQRLFDTRSIVPSRSYWSLSFLRNNLRFVWGTLFDAIEFFLFAFTGKSLTKREIFTAIKEADMVISAGGDALTPHYGFFLRLYAFWLFKVMRKPVIIYASTMGPFSGFSNKLVAGCLRKLDLVMARDQKSYDYLIGSGLSTDIVKRTADCVILLQQRNSQAVEQRVAELCVDKKTIGIFLKANAFSGVSDEEYSTYLDQMKDAATALDEEGYSVVFCAANNTDDAVTTDFMRSRGMSYPLVNLMDFQAAEAKEFLSRMGLVVTSRMHPAILASTAGVPVVGISNETKMLEYLKIIGIPELYLKQSDFSVEKLTGLVNSTLSGTDVVRRLGDNIRQAEALAGRNTAYLQEFLDRPASSPLRIALYMTTVLEHGGGCEKYLIQTARELSSIPDLEVTVFTMDEQRTWLISRILRPWRFFRSAPAAYQEETVEIRNRLGKVQYKKMRSFGELRDNLDRYDVVYSKNELLEAAIFKLCIGYRRLPPIVFVCATPLVYPNARSLYAKLHNFLYDGLVYRFLAKGVACFQPLNENDKRVLERNFSSKPIKKIPNVIDVDKFRALAVENPYLRDRFGSGKYRILWVGRLTEAKGIDNLSDIVAVLNSDPIYGPKVEWHVFGEGHEEHKIHQLTKLWGNVIFHGYVPNLQMASVYGYGDLLLSTSKWESFGLTILEANAMDLPAIAYNIPGPCEVISNDTNGNLANNTEGLIDLIKSYVDGKKLSGNPSETVRERFGIDRHNDDLITLFKNAKAGS